MFYLEKELVVWSVEDILEVRKSDSIRTDRKFDEVWSVFIVDVVDHLRLLRHPNPPLAGHAGNLKEKMQGREGGGCWWQVEAVTSDKPAVQLGLGRVGHTQLLHHTNRFLYLSHRARTKGGFSNDLLLELVVLWICGFGMMWLIFCGFVVLGFRMWLNFPTGFFVKFCLKFNY